MKLYPLFVLCFAIIIGGCASPSANKTNTSTSENQPKELTVEAGNSLQEKLDAKRNKFNATASETKKAIYAEGIEAVAGSGILESALNVGDTAPDFTLNNATGDAIRLFNVLQKGPVILTWYRGGWCPYCNITLAALQETLPQFEAQGAKLLALTPELPDKSMSTAEKHQLDFEVLSDIDNTVAKEYGVVFELTPEVAEIYQASFDLHGYNGNQSNELPLAATYIINKEGIIEFAFLHPDYRNRAEPETLLNVLKKMQSKS
jgi:peroxiredoxin